MLQKLFLKALSLSLVLWGITSFFGWSQTPCDLTLKGKVVNAHSKELLPFAAMYIREADQVTTSEEDGTFLFARLCPGKSYHLEVHFLGFLEFHQDLVLENDTIIVISLVPEDQYLEEVNVTGTRIEEHTLEQVARIEGAELRANQSQSIGKVLEGVNGVRSLQSGPSVFKPVIHGLHSNRILIFQNDIRLEGQQWGTEHAPEIDPFQAENIQVMKGASAVRYGAEAIGGVIVIEPPSLPEEAAWNGSVTLNGSANGRQGNVAAQVSRGSEKVQGLGWRLQGSFKQAGDFEAPSYGLPNTGLQEMNFSGAIGLNRPGVTAEIFASRYAGEFGILRSAHIGNSTDLEAAIVSDTPFFIQPFTYTIDNPRQQITHDLVKVDLEIPLGDRGDLDVIYGWQNNQRQEYDRRRGGRSSKPALDMRLFTNTLDVHWHHPYHDHWKGTVGVSGIWKVNDNIPGTGVRPLIPAYRAGRASVFALEQYITDSWELEAGVRYDEHFLRVLRFDDQGNLIKPQYSFRNPSATIGGIYKFSSQLSLRTILATAWRPPDVSELYSEGLHHGAAALEQGDSTLVSETAYKLLTTLSWTGERGRVEVDAYFQRIQNYIYLQPSGEPALTIRGAFLVFNYTQTDAQLAGWDVSAQYLLLDQLKWYGQYSAVRGWDLKTKGSLFLMPADKLLNRLAWETNENTKVPIRVWAEHVFVAEQTRIATDVDFAPPPPAYHLVNGGITVTPTLAGQPLEITLQVQNALNSSYRDYMNRYRYFVDELGRNISISLYYSF